MVSVYTVSAEPSGDNLAVGLIRELRARRPYIAIQAIGGETVRQEGFQSAIDTSPLAVLGFVEGLRALPAVNRLADAAVADILAKAPDAVVLIDSWGFSIRVAQRLKTKGYSGIIVKYVAPQVWAMRRGRAKVLARHVDHLLALHPFDAPFFGAVGLPTEVVGNPTLDTDWAGGDGAAFRARHGIAPDATVMMVAMGSRKSEIRRLHKVFNEAFVKLGFDLQPQRYIPRVMPVAPGMADFLEKTLWVSWVNYHRFKPEEMRDALAATDLALLKSGTITLQASDAGVPSVVAYKVSPLTYWAARLLMKADYISLVNVCAGRELLPEFVQHEATPDAISAALKHLIENPAARRARGEELRAVTASMRGEGGASAKVAEAVLRLVS